MCFNINKRLLVFAIVVCVMCSLFASNGSRILSLDDNIYNLIDDLYLLEGKAPERGARPWSVNMAIAYASKIEPTSEHTSALKEKIIDYLSEDEGAVDFIFSFTPQASYHTNTEFDTARKWVNPVLDEHLLAIGAGINYKDIITAEAALSLGLTPANNSNGKEISTNEKRYKEQYATNIPFLSEGSIDLSLVRRSYISVGNSNVIFSLGRDKQSWGNGLMGNLMLSATLPYHDYLRFGIASKNISFDTLAIFFTHPVNYGNNQNDKYSGLRFFLGHRLEFRMLKEKVRLTVNEAIMYQSENGYFDYRVLNPLLIMHSFYISEYANSLASLELEIAPIRDLQLYGSFVIDDLSVGKESKFPAAYATPNSWGVMGGIRKAFALTNNSNAKVTIEGAYITPFTYHRRNGETALSPNNHSLDYVGTIHYFDNNQILVQSAYLSFPFGSDALAVKLQGEYTIYNKLKASAHGLFMIHGVTDEYSIIHLSNVELKPIEWLCTSSPFEALVGNLSYTFNLGLNVEYNLTSYLGATASVDCIYVNGMNNEKDNNQFDIQLSLGVKLAL